MPVAAPGSAPRAYGSGFLNRLAAALDGQRRAGRVHRRPADGDDRRRRRAERLAQGHRQARRSTIGRSALLVEHVRRHALRAAHRRRLRPAQDRRRAGRDDGAAAAWPARCRPPIATRSPRKGFELEARRMAGLMRDKFNIGFIDVGGWDTHVNQGNAQGQLANLLTSLGQGLAGFADQMGPAWNRTVVFVLSEFGRTFRENGTRGTDHGHGSVHWVLGGADPGRPLRGRAGGRRRRRRSIRIATFRCSPNTARCSAASSSACIRSTPRASSGCFPISSRGISAWSSRV